MMKLLLASACAAFCLFATVTAAGTTPQVVSREPDKIVRATTVQTSDLEPGTATGQRQLDARIRKAALAVCRPPRSDNNPASWSVVRCYRNSVADARSGIGAAPSRAARVATRSAPPPRAAAE